MEGRETPRMHKYEESKTTQIIMATVCHVTAWAGRTKYQAVWFLLNRVYIHSDDAVLTICLEGHFYCIDKARSATETDISAIFFLRGGGIVIYEGVLVSP